MRFNTSILVLGSITIVALLLLIFIPLLLLFGVGGIGTLLLLLFLILIIGAVAVPRLRGQVPEWAQKSLPWIVPAGIFLYIVVGILILGSRLPLIMESVLLALCLLYLISLLTVNQKGKAASYFLIVVVIAFLAINIHAINFGGNAVSYQGQEGVDTVEQVEPLTPEQQAEQEERNRPRNTEGIAAPPGQSLSLPRSGQYTLPESLVGKDLNVCFTHLGIPGNTTKGQEVTVNGQFFNTDQTECFPIDFSEEPTVVVDFPDYLVKSDKFPGMTDYEIYSDPTIVPNGVGVPPQIVGR